VANNGSDNIEGYSHFNEHCHYGPAEIMRSECRNWQPRATREEAGSNMGRSQRISDAGTE
jgi:hypothetical protein